MKKINDSIFAILKYALWGEKVTDIDGRIDYTVLYKELISHRVDCLITEVWGEFDQSLQTDVVMAAVQNVSKWHQLMQLQSELVHLFQDENIPFVVLKGAAANIYYSNPEYRRMGDIDVIVKPSAFEHAEKTLLNAGYAVVGESKRHIEFVKQGKIVELHRCFVVIEDDNDRKCLDDYIYEMIDYAEWKSICNYQFPMLPKLENGLTLLYHICQHLEIGLGLRQIIDWMLFVDKELNDEFWYCSFQAKAGELGLEKLAVVVTRMCQKYLGLRETINWCNEADDILCEELMGMIMESGNFGRKLTKVEHKIVQSGSVSSFFILLQQFGIKNWELIEKYPGLKAFAWLYQLVKYIKILWKRKMSLAEVISEMRRSKNKSDLLNLLGVTRRFSD